MVMTMLRVRCTIRLKPAPSGTLYSATHRKTFPTVIRVMPQEPELSSPATIPSSSASSTYPAPSLIMLSSRRAERAIMPRFVFNPDSSRFSTAHKQEAPACTLVGVQVGPFREVPSQQFGARALQATCALSVHHC